MHDVSKQKKKSQCVRALCVRHGERASVPLEVARIWVEMTLQALLGAGGVISCGQL